MALSSRQKPRFLPGPFGRRQRSRCPQKRRRRLLL